MTELHQPRPRRKAIPLSVKRTVMARQHDRCVDCGEPLDDTTEFDHRPALWARPVNASGTDYEPAQNDPAFIEGLHGPCHLKRTTGRLPGAERTITTKGSDAHLKAKFNRLEGRTKPRHKKKIPSRPFPKGRKFARPSH